MFVAAVVARGQTPTVVQALPTRTLVAGGASASIHLRDYFGLPTVTGPVVQFDTSKGKFNVELFSADTPKTAANFVSYTRRGAYVNSFVHRTVNNFVIQGGGFVLNGNSVDPIVTDPPIENEAKFSNTRGTIAMAKTPVGPHTATSQWFINLKNNATPLDTENGGYTVFGRVLGTGMTVVDAIAAVPTYNASATLGAAFGELPLLNNELIAANFVMSSIRSAPVFPEVASATSALAFSATSSNPAVAAVEVVASTLMVKPIAAGSTIVTARVVDPNGNAQQTSFTATVVGDPSFITEPVSQAVAQGGGGTLSAAATG
ncbi:MAG TPA: peptidylprolyl isomerase, partial [Opitutus sp.]|nr:peptidylprolyl isomerase [Opitutus sp.]